MQQTTVWPNSTEWSPPVLGRSVYESLLSKALLSSLQRWATGVATVFMIFNWTHGLGGVCVCVCVCVNVKLLQSCPTLCDPMKPTRLLCSWDSPDKDTGGNCHALLQRLFLTQGSNLPLLWFLHCRWSLYCWATREAWMHGYFVVTASLTSGWWIWIELSYVTSVKYFFPFLVPELNVDIITGLFD